MRIFAIGLLLVLAICGPAWGSHIDQPVGKSAGAPWVIAGGALMERVSRQLSDRYNLEAVGAGGEMMTRIDLLRLCFEYRGDLSEKEARKVVVESVDIFVREINRDEKVRPFLAQYPATANTVSLSITIYNEGGSSREDPLLSVAGFSRGEVYFKTVDPKNRHRFQRRSYEPLSEARALVNRK